MSFDFNWSSFYLNTRFLPKRNTSLKLKKGFKKVRLHLQCDKNISQCKTSFRQLKPFAHHVPAKKTFSTSIYIFHIYKTTEIDNQELEPLKPKCFRLKPSLIRSTKGLVYTTSHSSPKLTAYLKVILSGLLKTSFE